MEIIKFKWDNTPKFFINLDKREDRRDLMIKTCPHELIRWAGIAEDNVVVPTTSVKIHEYNARSILACMTSHKTLIQHAKDNNYEYICIYEDDIEWSKDFDKRISFVESLELDFDTFYLGGHYDNQHDITPTNHPYVHKIKNVAGSYAYIIRNTIYDFILNNMTYDWGVDQFFGTVVQALYNCYAFIPFMVGHLDGYSDVARHETAYDVNKMFNKEIILK